MYLYCQPVCSGISGFLKIYACQDLQVRLCLFGCIVVILSESFVMPLKILAQ